jgi:hypothetical protein
MILPEGSSFGKIIVSKGPFGKIMDDPSPEVRVCGLPSTRGEKANENQAHVGIRVVEQFADGS